MATVHQTLPLSSSSPSLFFPSHSLHSKDETGPLSGCATQQSSVILIVCCVLAEDLFLSCLRLLGRVLKTTGLGVCHPSSEAFFFYFQLWRMMKMTSPALGQMGSFCTTTAAKKNVRNSESSHKKSCHRKDAVSLCLNKLFLM